MTFTDFFQLKEAKFRESLSDPLTKQIQDLAELYFHYYSSSNKQSFKRLLKEGKIERFSGKGHWKTYFENIQIDMPTYYAPYITTIKVFDKESKSEVNLDVHCIYGDVTGDYASYVDYYKTINIFDEILRGLPVNTVKSKILHEITHGLQEYKLTSSEYEKVSSKDPEDISQEEMDIYFMEPIEFDAHTNEIAFNIREKYKFLVGAIKKAGQPETKKIFQNKLRLFFQQLKVFIFADPKSYFELEELILPDFLVPIDGFVESLKQYPKLWQKMKSKMLNLYKELVSLYNQLPEEIRQYEQLNPIPRLGVD